MDFLITNWISKKVLDELFSTIKSKLVKNSVSVLSRISDLETNINLHIKQVENWTSEISTKEMTRPKSISGTFIELDSYVTSRRKTSYKDSNLKHKLIPYIVDNIHSNIIILGEPGSGKTTSIKKVCQNLLHQEGFLPDINFPIVIRLKELSFDETLLVRLFRIFGFSLYFKTQKSEFYITANNLSEFHYFVQNPLFEFLDGLKILLVLDGLDEIDEIKRSKIIKELEQLSFSFNESRFLLTSRTADYFYKIENSIETEICELSPEQVSEFSTRWLGDQQRADVFLRMVHSTPFRDTVLRPLNLAHLLAIFERENSIPDKPKSVYKRLINLILEEWDQQRSIVRISKYANFQRDIKLEFLSNLAFQLTVVHRTYIFSDELLEDIYKLICTQYHLPLNESKHVINEIESHNGLVLQSSYNRYEFAHKSFQEYLCAYYIIGLKKFPDINIILRIPNELAVCVSISSNHNEYLYELILSDLRTKVLSKKFVLTFFNRLTQEKVDFYPHANVACVVLFILTKIELDDEIQYVSNGYLDNSDIDGVKFDFAIFPRFVLDNGLQQSIHALSQFYRVKEFFYEHYNGNKYIVLEHNNDLETYTYPLKLFLPYVLKEHFFS